MSEKRTEEFLYQLLKDNLFEDKFIFRTPNEHPTLKNIFAKASKTGNGQGIPDRLYFDEKVLIVFECKKSCLDTAQKDLKLYKKRMSGYDEFEVFFVGVIEDAYEIYNLDFVRLNLALNINNFKEMKDVSYTNQQMEKDLHKIHNYIRDYTKISNEDKSFFIACILISLTKNSFIEVIKNYDTKKYIYDILKQNLHDFDIDISVFEFLRNDENNTHFLNIINMVKSIYDKNPDEDLLNHFYSEFVKYSNTDGKSLGIVLTPDHIVKLMVEMLTIKPTDTVLDLCTGTGSFLLEASKRNPEKLIGCEYQTKLYSLMKCNFILRGLSLTKNELVKGDCFDHEFKATKSIINPPYGMRDKKELDFLLKQLESVEEGGLVCAIIPKSKLNSNRQNNKYKQGIMNLGIVKTIINCNPKLFYPTANIACCILLIEKRRFNGTSYLTNIINYEEDGIEIQKHRGMVKSDLFEHRYEELLNAVNNPPQYNLTLDNDWCYIRLENQELTNLELNISYLDLQQLEREFRIKRQYILDNPRILNISNAKAYKVSDIFNVHTCRRITITHQKNNVGEYPYITASKENDGITGYINTWTHDGSCLTIANSGSVGYTKFRNYKFCGTDSIYVLELKNNLTLNNLQDYEIFEVIFTNIGKEYSFSRALRLCRLMEEHIYLKIIDNVIYF
jgi:type I restriction enzyme M protein